MLLSKKVNGFRWTVTLVKCSSEKSPQLHPPSKNKLNYSPCSLGQMKFLHARVFVLVQKVILHVVYKFGQMPITRRMPNAPAHMVPWVSVSAAPSICSLNPSACLSFNA